MAHPLLDFLFGRKSLEDAAKYQPAEAQASPAPPNPGTGTPAYTQADIAGMAQKQADQQKQQQERQQQRRSNMASQAGSDAEAAAQNAGNLVRSATITPLQQRIGNNLMLP